VKGSAKSWMRNVTSLFYTLICFFIILEGVFMFIPQSHFAGIPLCSKIWFYRYWKPINEYGFRDKPVSKTKKINIFTLGDSFTAGHGLKKISDRYSNILEELLIKRYPDLQVINLGVNGSDTKDEYNTMTGFIQSSQIKPDMIILQYFCNDIEKVAKKNGIKFTGFTSYDDLYRGFDQIVKSSYFFNYLYWIYPHVDVGSYIEFLNQSYKDEYSFKEHLKDIDLFATYSREANVPFLLLLFPFMQDLTFSENLYIGKLAVFCKERSISFIDVAQLISNIPVQDRVINNNDGHSSPLVNRCIANNIYNYILIHQKF